MGSRNSKGPPPLPDDRKVRIQRFQEEAGRVIAESGGLNAGCQVKLMALGEKLGLSEEEVLEAIGSLQAAPKTWVDGSSAEARQERFRQHVLHELADRQGGLLLPGEEKTLIGDGTQPPFALPKSAAQRIVRQVARRKRLSLMSSREAKLHVVRLVRQVMGESGTLSTDGRTRIREEGAKYGLTPGQVESIIRNQAKENRFESLINLGAPALAILAALVVVGFFVFLIIPRRPRPEPTVVREVPVEAPSGGQWWDATLVVAIGKARSVLPEIRPALKAIESTVPEVRAGAYAALLAPMIDGADRGPGSGTPESGSPTESGVEDSGEDEWLVTVLEAEPPSEGADEGPWWPAPEGEPFGPVKEGSEDEPRRAVLEDESAAAALRDVVVGCHALEPSDACAQRLRTALVDLVPGVEGGLPYDAFVYDVAFWTIETAVAALEHPQLDAKRAESLAQAIGERLSVDVDRCLMPEEQTEHCLGALSAHLYKVLIAGAGADPDRAREHLDELADRAEKYLDPGTLDGLTTDFLLAVLPAAPDDWREYRSLIRRAARSENWQSLERLIDWYEKSGNRELERYLSGLFLARFDVGSELSSPAELAAAIRRMIHVASSTRADRFHELAARVLAETPRGSHDPEALLRTTVSLAEVATLGCALAQNEPGYATYDQLLNELESDHASRAAGTRPAAGVSGSALPRSPVWVTDSVMDLQDSSQLATGTRVASLKRLADAAGRIRDLTPEQGATVARYLLRPKQPAEYERVLEHVDEIGRWKHVRLGLADELSGVGTFGVSRLQQERVVEVISAVLGWQIAPAENEPWAKTQSNLSRMLLRHVYDSLRADDEQDEDDRPEVQMHRLYTTQAKLLGVPTEEYLAATTPAEVLRRMVLHYAGTLPRQGLGQEDAKYVDRLPHELAAADYLGENPLAGTVLIERIWARLVAIGAVQENPNQTAHVQKLLRELSRSDRDAAHVLAQLYDGQRALVQLWMAFVEPTAVETK
ncbi:MAG TPA: hypothetical protein VMY37_32880 [Thermoguttaceae bacterium]|nr:hypothetical protein [Thermoguttaceae bacterium]